MSRPSDKHLSNFYTNIMRGNALLYKYQFLVQLMGPADLGWNNSASQNFSYYVQSGSIPGTKLVNGKTVFFGTEFRIPGVKQFDHNWQTEILIDQDLTIYKKLETPVMNFVIGSYTSEVDAPKIEKPEEIKPVNHRELQASYGFASYWILAIVTIVVAAIVAIAAFTMK
mgnify:CR=1 FL=1